VAWFFKSRVHIAVLEDNVNRIKAVVALVMLGALIAGCSGSGGSNLTPGTTGPAFSSPHKLHPSDTLGGVGNYALNILLTDAPPQIGGMTASAVNLGIDSVAVINNGQATTLESFSTPYVVNVMNNAGTPSPIAIGQFYQGSYQQLRFTIDIASSNVVANGQAFPLSFMTGENPLSSAGAGPSSFSYGSPGTVSMVVNGNFSIGGDPAAAVDADFNALESLAPGPPGTIVARPTLFAVADGLAGKADGVVLNASGSPVSGATVVALDQSGNVANTTSTDVNGAFDLHTIGQGTYQLVIYNSYNTVAGQTLTATGNSSTAASVQGPMITVTAGQTAQVGTIAD
jgi:hypothetical protein